MPFTHSIESTFLLLYVIVKNTPIITFACSKYLHRCPIAPSLYQKSYRFIRNLQDDLSFDPFYCNSTLNNDLR